MRASHQSRKPWRAALCDLLCLFWFGVFVLSLAFSRVGQMSLGKVHPKCDSVGCWLRLPGHPQGIWSFWKQWPQLIALFQGGSDSPQCCGNLLSLRKAAQRAVLVYIGNSFFVYTSVKELLNLWEQKGTIWKWVPSPVPAFLNTSWKFWSEVFLLLMLEASEDWLLQGPPRLPCCSASLSFESVNSLAFSREEQNNLYFCSSWAILVPFAWWIHLVLVELR